MQKRFYRIVALLVCVMMLATSLIACGNKDTGDTTASGSSAQSSASASASAANTFEKPIKFTFSSVDANKAGIKADGSEEENFKWFKEKFNVDFEFYPLDWSNYIDQTRLWLAAGDAPDLMMLDIDATRYPEYVQWARDGLFKAYPEFGDKYPNLKKRMDGMVTGQKFYVDDKLYAWPAYLDLANYNYRQINLPYYRKDWATKVGLAKGNDEYTWDEWVALVKAVQTQDPGGNGVGNTIGMYGQTWMFPEFFGPGGIAPMMNQIYKKDGKWVWGVSEPETLEAFKLTKQLYDEGIIWKDQPLVKSDTLKEMFVAGKAFSLNTGNATVQGTIIELADEMVKVNPNFKPETDLRVAKIKGPNGKLLCREMADQWSQQAMNANMSDEKVDRWMAILDYMVSDEGYYVRNLGIPEKDWKLDANGKPEILWSKDANGVPQYPYKNGSWPWMRAFGCNDGFDLINPVYAKWAQDMITDLYERLNEPDVDVIKLDPDLSYYSGPLWDKKGQNVKAFQDVMIDALANNKDPETVWKKYVDSEKADVDALLAELQANLK